MYLPSSFFFPLIFSMENMKCGNPETPVAVNEIISSNARCSNGVCCNSVVVEEETEASTDHRSGSQTFIYSK